MALKWNRRCLILYLDDPHTLCRREMHRYNYMQRASIYFQIPNLIRLRPKKTECIFTWFPSPSPPSRLPQLPSSRRRRYRGCSRACDAGHRFKRIARMPLDVGETRAEHGVQRIARMSLDVGETRAEHGVQGIARVPLHVGETRAGHWF